jgi:glycosyltransferase involved in cell wall biosynthesis
MKKNILLLIKSKAMGGAEFLLLDYFRSINYDKNSITLASVEDPFTSYLLEDNLPVSVVRTPNIDSGANFISILLKYYVFYKRHNPQSIVFNQFELQSYSQAEVIAAYLVAPGKVYMILHSFPFKVKLYRTNKYFGCIPSLGYGWRKYRLYQKLLVHFCNCVLVVSNALKQALIDDFHYKPSKIEVVNHGVDTIKFSPLPAKKNVRKSLNIPLTDSVIVSTSRLVPAKKLERLIHAFNDVASERVDIHLFIVGTGKSEQELIALVGTLNEVVKSRVHFFGFQKNVELYLQSSDIYVLSSDYEGFSISCLEAMSCGLIPIVTDCGGPRDFIQNGDNGLIVERSSEGIRRGLTTILRMNKLEKKLLIDNARNHVLSHYKLEGRVKFALQKLGVIS